MKTLKFLLLLFLIGLALSCTKKKYPESMTINEPIFYSKFTVNGTPVLYEAGKNNYRLYSSFIQDTVSNSTSLIYSFNSEFKQQDCSGNCANSIKISINDFKFTTLNEPLNINTALSQPKYYFQNNNYSYQFTCSFNKTAASYFWDFGDGTTKDTLGLNVFHTYKQSGNYNVNLKIKSNTGCESSITNVIKIGKPNACVAEFSFNNANANIITFSSIANGTAPFKYEWNFGDGTTSNQVSPNHTYLVRGAYPVSLQVTDASNDVASYNMNVTTKNDLSSCATNFTYNQISTQDIPFSKIKITYTDATGKVFTSDNSSQLSSSNFQILSIEDYEANENNEATKKIKIKFNCNVYNGSNALSISDAEMVMTVAYK